MLRRVAKFGRRHGICRAAKSGYRRASNCFTCRKIGLGIAVQLMRNVILKESAFWLWVARFRCTARLFGIGALIICCQASASPSRTAFRDRSMVRSVSPSPGNLSSIWAFHDITTGKQHRQCNGV